MKKDTNKKLKNEKTEKPKKESQPLTKKELIFSYVFGGIIIALVLSAVIFLLVNGLAKKPDNKAEVLKADVLTLVSENSITKDDLNVVLKNEQWSNAVREKALDRKTYIVLFDKDQENLTSFKEKLVELFKNLKEHKDKKAALLVMDVSTENNKEILTNTKDITDPNDNQKALDFILPLLNITEKKSPMMFIVDNNSFKRDDKASVVVDQSKMIELMNAQIEAK